ncbi:BTAD domain-containing putative transcriptional regulator [Streptomyces olivoreticuli]
MTCDFRMHTAHWLQLMLALYRSGKQAGVLAAHMRLRQGSAENLGIDPGRRLQGCCTWGSCAPTRAC